MKRITLITLIVCAVGIVFMIAGICLAKGNVIGGKDNMKKTEKHYTCSSDIDELIVNESSVRTVVATGDVERPEIKYYVDDETEEVTITEKNGKLSVTREEKSMVHLFNIDFDLFDYTTEITLPKDYNGKVYVESSSGGAELYALTGSDIVVDSSSGSIEAKNIRAEELVLSASSGSVVLNEIEVKGKVGLKTSSGRVKAEDVECNDLEAKASSGSIEFKKIEAENVKAEATSGSIGCYEITAENDISLANSSGSITVENSSSKSLNTKNSSGGHRYNDVKADTVYTESTSGNVNFDNLNIGKKGEFHSTSGGVHGTVAGAEEDFSIITSTTSGSSNLNNSRSGNKTLDITTTSGNISVKFE